MKRRRWFFIIVSVAILQGSQALASESEKSSVHGFIDFNGYYDTRDFNMFTLNLLATLPVQLSYFSFTNFSNAAGTNQNFDLDSFYTEQNLHWGLSQDLPVDLTTQWAIGSGQGNDLARFGVRWIPSSTQVIRKFFEKINLTYMIYFHLLQTDFDPSPGWGWQVEHVYRIMILPGFLDKRVYLSGFADHNMNYGGVVGGDNHLWVTEHQLGVRLVSGLYTVGEFRRNEFLASKNGIGVGLEYIVDF